MWFLRGRPKNITVNALVQSVAKGYQTTNYRFKVAVEPELCKDGQVWIALPFPWAPHKPDGSFVIADDVLSGIAPCTDLQTVSRDQITLHITPRALKKSADVELVHVQELGQWYLDDIGVASFWVRPDTWYQVNYTHKIASDSCLFLPTRLPTIILAHKPELEYTLWVLDGWNVGIPQHLTKEQHSLENSRLSCYKFKEWNWDNDTHIHTENWESSDDASDSSDS